jgi:NADH:ubiquinone oxidoreductase subunit
MTINTRIYTAFYGEFVGADAFGNRYFRRKFKSESYDKRSKEKRWVLYTALKRPFWMWPILPASNRMDLAEPSKIPAEWHSWLHYTMDKPPTERTVLHHQWEKPHQPNLTGTVGAYMPPGAIQKGGERDAATSDYQAWKP